MVLQRDRTEVSSFSLSRWQPAEGMTAMDSAKPFWIAKLDVWEAYK